MEILIKIKGNINQILMEILIKINGNINFPRDLEIPGWCPVGNSVTPRGEETSLALVGNSSSNGITINILFNGYPKPRAERALQPWLAIFIVQVAR